MTIITNHRLNAIVNKYQEWISMFVTDGKHDCEHSFKQFETFCNLRQYPVVTAIKRLQDLNIKCDCDIILDYQKLKEEF